MYYAFKLGECRGIYKDHLQAKSLGKLYKQHYRKFTRLSDAKQYLKDLSYKDYLKLGYACIFTDGSYCSKTNRVGYAAVVLRDKQFVELYSGSCENRYGMKNAVGELTAVIKGLMQCKDDQKIVIYHDFTRIRYWGLGLWKTQNDFTWMYKNAFRRLTENKEIKFVKVGINNRISWHEKADRHASYAANHNI